MAGEGHADRALARALLSETLPDVLAKHRDVGVSTRSPREVYRLVFPGAVNESRDSVLAARHAVDSLARLHADGELAIFRGLMRKVFRWREDAFGGAIFQDKMPTFTLTIECVDSLSAAEWFCVDEETAPTTPPVELEIRVVLVDASPTMEFLSRTTSLVERLTSPQSHFRVIMVDLELGDIPVKDEVMLRATCRLADMLLCLVPTLDMCNVSCRIPAGGGDDEGGLRFPHTLGVLFQALLRVGRARLLEPQAAREDYEIRDSDLNNFKVIIANNTHPRVRAALWSAVAYSRGYNVLQIEEEPAYNSRSVRDDEAEAISTKYLITALLLGQSDVKRLLWRRRSVLAREADVAEKVHTEWKLGNSLAGALWDRDWSLARHGLVFETTTLNEEIAGQCGWVLHDPGHGLWIDVFVPGFAQCTIKRDRWNQIARPFVALDDVRRLHKLNLTINSASTDRASHTARLTTTIGESLDRLSFQDAPISASGFLSLLESCPNLRHLKFQFSPIAEHVMIEVSRIRATRLTSLEISTEVKVQSTGACDGFLAVVLPVISANLTRVRIQNPTANTFPMLSFRQSFQALVESSPLLEELVLVRAEVHSLDSLTTAYQRQTTKLSVIRLVQCPVESSSLVTFAEALGDPACLGARQLKLLYIQHTSSHVPDRQLLRGLDVLSIRALLAVMRASFSLQSLLLLAQTPADNPQDAHAILDEFKAFRGEDAVSYETWRRQHSSKMLASVLESRKLAWNEEILAQVFQFIAFERRDIALHFE